MNPSLLWYLTSQSVHGLFVEVTWSILSFVAMVTGRKLHLMFTVAIYIISINLLAVFFPQMLMSRTHEVYIIIMCCRNDEVCICNSVLLELHNLMNCFISSLYIKGLWYLCQWIKPFSFCRGVFVCVCVCVCGGVEGFTETIAIKTKYLAWPRVGINIRRFHF